MEITCLDTNVIISLIKKDERTAKIVVLRKVATTSINIFELECWESLNIENRSHIRNTINIIETFPLTKNAASLAGSMYLDMIKNKNAIEMKDALIAAICIENNLILFTYNIKHFEPMKKFGLKILES